MSDEARQRALDASVTPDAEIFWTFEKALARWVMVQAQREAAAQDPHPDDLTAG